MLIKIMYLNADKDYVLKWEILKIIKLPGGDQFIIASSQSSSCGTPGTRPDLNKGSMGHLGPDLI